MHSSINTHTIDISIHYLHVLTYFVLLYRAHGALDCIVVSPRIFLAPLSGGERRVCSERLETLRGAVGQIWWRCQDGGREELSREAIGKHVILCQ